MPFSGGRRGEGRRPAGQDATMTQTDTREGTWDTESSLSWLATVELVCEGSACSALNDWGVFCARSQRWAATPSD